MSSRRDLRVADRTSVRERSTTVTVEAALRLWLAQEQRTEAQAPKLAERKVVQIPGRRARA